jgi:polysaccharide deacetylase 2 family uncharacterized protein YibQ
MESPRHEEEAVPTPPAQFSTQGHLVLIIDDLGQELEPARRLAALGAPVVFSILPFAPKAEETARLAHRHGLDVLVHMPCEPYGYPHPNSGPGTLRSTMDASAIHSAVETALARVPFAIGANNHMGSRFTEHQDQVQAMLETLQKHGKIFVDSVTTPRTAVPRACAQLGLPYLRRTVFLDNIPTEAAIGAQLRKAESLAQQKGVAIALGHPHPQTIAALKRWIPERRVRIVALSQVPLVAQSLPQHTAVTGLSAPYNGPNPPHDTNSPIHYRTR